MLREFESKDIGTVFWLDHKPWPDPYQTLMESLCNTSGVEDVENCESESGYFFIVRYRGIRISVIPDDPEILDLFQPPGDPASPLLREFAERLNDQVEGADRTS